MSRVVIVVPCFNEEKRIDVQAFTSFALRDHALSFCFVNDGSTDDTLRVLASIRDTPKATPSDIVDLERNSGKAEAVRRGFAFALARKPDYIGYWDADLAAPLSELHAFVDLMEARPALEIVFGSRVKLMGRTIERMAWRHYLGRMSATLVSATLALPIYDTQCGHKLFRTTDVLARVFAEPFSTNWLFDVEILARFLTMDPRGRDHVSKMIYELPLTQWVDVRGSKVKATDFARGLREVWQIKRRYQL
jgi:glycosyltransferase involved in cell wall biosynthesis